MSSITGQASRTECYEPRRVDGSRSLTSHSLRSSSSVIGGMPHGHSTGIYCRGSIRMHQFQQRSVASEVMFGRNLGHLQRRPFGRYGINGYRPRWPLVFAGKRLRRRSRRVLPLDVSRNLSRGAANRKRSHWSTLLHDSPHLGKGLFGYTFANSKTETMFVWARMDWPARSPIDPCSKSSKRT